MAKKVNENKKVLEAKIEGEKWTKALDDSFKKIVVAKTGLKPSYDEKGVMIIDLFDFLMDSVEL